MRLLGGLHARREGFPLSSPADEMWAALSFSAAIVIAPTWRVELLNSALKLAVPAYLNLAKREAKLRTARKITTCVIILPKHPCDAAARRVFRPAVKLGNIGIQNARVRRHRRRRVAAERYRLPPAAARAAVLSCYSFI